MTSEEKKEIVINVLKENGLAVCQLNVKQFDGLSELELLVPSSLNQVVKKIKRYEEYIDKDKMKYNNIIMGDMREYMGLKRVDTSKDLEIYQMDRKDVLSAICRKNGLEVYGSTIIEWIENIYQIKLKDEI